jgi:hypothetical protein
MTTKVKAHGAALATAAALLFATLPAHIASAADAKMKCEGANACKGQSACKTAKNACAGQNACKGQGFVELTQTECDAAKGKMKEKM